MKFHKHSNLAKYRYSLAEDIICNAVFDINSENITNAYNEKIPLAEKKYKDLTNFCKNGIIPKAYHKEYINMPHDNKKVDTLDSEEEPEN